MKSILVTGCNRGIGLGLIRQLTQLPNPPEKIFATCRDITKAEKLTELAKKNSNVHMIELELKDTKKYDKIVEIVREKVGDDGLNVLFNSAGIAKFPKMGEVKEEDMIETYLVNTIVPIMMTQAFLPLLKKAAEGKDGMGIHRAAVINMSSRVASITENTLGGMYAHRCSKTALNAATKSMSIDLVGDGILSVAIEPGWVKTDNGGPNAPLEVDTSVSNIIGTLQSLNKDHNGCYIMHTGKLLPW